MTHPFRFSVQAGGIHDRRSWTDLARKVEGLGFSTLTIADHVVGSLAPVVALTAAAGVTDRLRLATLVVCNDFRHPVMLAKEAATLDLLSEGRLELGVGAGWMPEDYATSGIGLDPAGTRIDRLAEAITVLDGLFGDGPFSFAGDHYTVTGLDGSPKPLQRPRPPLIVGGGGPRILRLAARRADIVGLNPDLRGGVIGPEAGPSATAAATDTKVGWIRHAAGDRFDAIELHVRIHATVVTDDRDELLEAMAPAFGLTTTQARESPHALVGTVDQIAEDLLARRERFGISYVGVSEDVVDAIAPVVARLSGT